MKQPFPRQARQGRDCPHCGGETLLSRQSPETYECLDCGETVKPAAADSDRRKPSGDKNEDRGESA
jgi:ribosomal protein L37AE/L43A